VKPLALQSEPYSPLGNISASGIGKILGTPQHDRLRILVRETVQNVWDARHKGHGSLEYHIRLRTLRPDEVAVLRNVVFAEIPPDAEDLSATLNRPGLMVLEVIDFGTSGLGGPLRPDQLPTGKEANDFVDFVRNIGSLRDRQHGGGTYGYGKSALYNLSRCRTICVHTLARFHGLPEQRLIACRLGTPFVDSERRYTGRHWWGRKSSDKNVDPAIERDAADIAGALALPDRPEGRFGTSIMVIAPNLEHRSPPQAIDSIRETLLWHFWPKLVASEDGNPAMLFSVELEGSSHPLPLVQEVHPLALYAEAMRALKNGAAEGVCPIKCRKPIQRLGTLAVRRGPIASRPLFDTGDEASQIPQRSAHVALMRPAELVVKYLEADPLPSDLVEYAGVFVCSEDVEPAFAAAEPPAHDDWTPDYLTGRDKRFVTVALRRIRETLHEMVEATTRGQGDGEHRAALGRLADRLGGILIGQTGQRVIDEGGKTGTRGSVVRRGRRAVRVSQPQGAGYRVVDGVPCALFRVPLAGDGTASITLLGAARVLLEGGGSTGEPEGVETPEVVAWLSDAHKLLGRGGSLVVSPTERDGVVAAVRLPRDCAVTLVVTSEEGR